MPVSRYALVAYVRDSVGHFVEELRRELHPELPHMAAHVTILPPRPLEGSEAAALEFLEEACSRVIPFDAELGEVETFLPVTPTVFIQLKRAAYRLRELHDQLCAKGLLLCQEEWPYMPHLTIVKMEREEQAREAFEIARERWAQFPNSREIHVNELMFVREQDGVWQDLAAIPLGRSLLSAPSHSG
jgi:2'-5' RNA ligase